MKIIQSFLQEGLGEAMACGRKCNEILGVGNDIRWTAGSIIGGLLGGPWGMIYGGARPSESLQNVCRCKCKLSNLIKNKAPREDIKEEKLKLKNYVRGSQEWIDKFIRNDEPEKAAIMKKRLSGLMRVKF